MGWVLRRYLSDNEHLRLHSRRLIVAAHGPLSLSPFGGGRQCARILIVPLDMIALLVASILAAQAGVLAPLEQRVAVLLFVRTDCPISNRYAPEIQRIEQRFHKPGVTFRLVYPEAGATEESIERH